MLKTEIFLRNEKNVDVLRLAWSDEKYKFDTASDFERFSFICKNSRLLPYDDFLSDFADAIFEDTGIKLSFSLLDRICYDKISKLWRCVFCGEEPIDIFKSDEQSMCYEADEYADALCKEKLESGKDSEKFFSVKQMMPEMTAEEREKPESVETLVGEICGSEDFRLSRGFILECSDCEYKRLNPYLAEQIYRKVICDEKYKSNDKSDVASLEFWILCRVLMKENKPVYFFIKGDNDIKFIENALSVFSRLKLSPKIAVCFNPETIGNVEAVADFVIKQSREEGRRVVLKPRIINADNDGQAAENLKKLLRLLPVNVVFG